MRLALITSVWILWAAQAVAHHAEAVYDRAQTLSVSGTVKIFLWANPHTLIYLEVTDSNGRTDVDVFEGGSVAVMQRSGWARDSLKVGDKLTIRYHPRRDTRHGGQLLTAARMDGTTLGWRPAMEP